MNVEDIMSDSPVTCMKDTSLQQAAQWMVDCNCGALPVVDSANKPVGVITDRDITCRTVARGRNPLELSVADAILHRRGTASATFSVVNPGTAAVTLSTPTLTGTDASQFQVYQNGCGTTLAAGAACTVGVQFKPTVAGSKTATLTVASASVYAVIVQATVA